MPTVRLNVFICAKSIRSAADLAMPISLLLTPSAKDDVLGV
ncbi:hypothetical protein [Chamaesiphon sp. GL140_3_metabinner_50]|nr:hypothetical protein [Chamaesiphon sp. GL140_3_metabinner_50]